MFLAINDALTGVLALSELHITSTRYIMYIYIYTHVYPPGKSAKGPSHPAQWYIHTLARWLSMVLYTVCCLGFCGVSCMHVHMHDAHAYA